jgi:hypothetical protein
MFLSFLEMMRKGHWIECQTQAKPDQPLIDTVLKLCIVIIFKVASERYF